MPKSSRPLRKNNRGHRGNAFEAYFKEQCLYQNLTCARIPNEYRGVRSGFPIQVKTGCDFAFSCYGRATFIDCKETEKGTLHLATYITHPKKIHQLVWLYEAECRGDLAGYLIHFIKHQTLTFVRAKTVWELHRMRGETSLTPTSGRSQPDHIPLDFKNLFAPDIK